MNALTAKQRDVMMSLSGKAGQTVEVITSEYDANINPEYRARAIFLGTVGSSTLAGLEKKGFIKIEETYWKGATLVVLKEMSE